MADYTDDEVRDLINRISVTGGGSRTPEITAFDGRVGYNQPINNSSSVDVGVSGHYAKGKRFKDVAADKIDATYKKRFENESELRARLGANLNSNMGKRGINEVGVEYEIPFKKGGKVKAKPKVSKASSRADGIARKGKTRGNFR